MAKLLSAPPRGLVLVLVLLLLASIKAAGPVMAEPEDQIVDVLEKLTTAALGRIEGMEDFAKGLKGGFKLHKIYSKVEALIDSQNPGARGTTYFVDTVAITGRTRLNVSTVDITATPAVRTGFCAAGEEPLLYRTSIRLFGSGGTVPLTPASPLPGTLQECPPVARAEQAAAMLGLGRGGDLSNAFRTFSYLVTSDAYTVVWFPPASSRQQKDTGATPLYYHKYRPNDGLYYVDITGIWVGQQRPVQATAEHELIVRPDGTGSMAYLSTTEPYTYLERGMYDRLKATLISQIQRLNSGAMPARLPADAGEKLCYEGTALTVPTMAILFAGGNNAALNFMELRGPNVWYAAESSTMICLAIRPGQAPVLGTRLQSGRPMTVDLSTAGGGQGVLTFPAICDVTSCLLDSDDDTSNSKRTSRVSAATYVLYFVVPLLVLLCQGRVTI